MKSQFGTSFIKNATLLTLAALFAKVLSVAYRIPYQNITGDLGFYIYQQVYPFYGIAYLLAMYGFPVVISKLISERHARADHTGAHNVFVLSFWLLTIVSITAFLCFYLFSANIAQLVGDPELDIVYRMAAFPFLAVPLIAVLRGTFQAQNDALPTAVSQMLEQIVRVTAIVGLAIYLMNHGFGFYAVGSGAIFSAFLGGLAGGLVLLFFQFRRGERFPLRMKQGTETDRRALGFQLFTEGTAISISALTLVLYQTIDALTVLQQLNVYEASLHAAKVAKGIYDRGQPLIQLGATVGTSLSLVIVPMVAKAKVEDRYGEIRINAGLAIKVSVVIGMAASGGLVIIMPETNQMLFMDTNGSSLLAFLGVAIFCSSLAMTAFATLQGLGSVSAVASMVTVGLVVKLLVNCMFISHYGLWAAAGGTVLGLGITTLLALRYLQMQLALFSNYRMHWFRIVGAVLSMLIVAYAWKTALTFVLTPFITGRLAATLIAMSTVLVAILFYLISLSTFRVFSNKELGYFPKRMRPLLKIKRKGES